MDTDSFIVYIKTDYIYKYIAEDVETRFDTPIFELARPLSKSKDELGGRIMAKFIGLRTKIYSYSIDGSSEDKKAKRTKKCVIKRKLKFENYKNWLEATQLDNKIKYLEKIKLT